MLPISIVLCFFLLLSNFLYPGSFVLKIQMCDQTDTLKMWQFLVSSRTVRTRLLSRGDTKPFKSQLYRILLRTNVGHRCLQSSPSGLLLCLLCWRSRGPGTVLTGYSFFFFFKHLYWSIIALQWCVSFRFITK